METRSEPPGQRLRVGGKCYPCSWFKVLPELLVAHIEVCETFMRRREPFMEVCETFMRRREPFPEVRETFMGRREPFPEVRDAFMHRPRLEP
jgi:hypothetical protein